MNQSSQTQSSYRLRANQLISRAKQEYDSEHLTPLQIAHWLIDKRYGFSKSTWRQYRAALIFAFKFPQTESSDAHALLIAINRLEQTQPAPGKKMQKRTSAQKTKKVRDEDLIRLLKYFSSKSPRYGFETQAWLLSGIWTGLRPCEWEEAKVNTNNELIVINAKSTNGRSHGKTRTIELTGLDNLERQVVDFHLKNVQQAKLVSEFRGDSGFSQFYTHCRSCLYQATRTLWPSRKQYISLYSARHQFSANAKKNGFSLVQIAALMGHASIETPATHYGRRSAGCGSMKVNANEEDMLRVLELNQHRMVDDSHYLRV